MVVAAVKQGLLGCGTTTCYITERGGGTRLLDIPYATVSYGRRLDEVSDCSIEVPVAEAIRTDCCLTLTDLSPWQHEISVYRDDTLVWVGPVVDVTYTRDTVTIAAKDLFQWFERRKIEGDFFPYEMDLSRIFRLYVIDALKRDTSPNIT